MQNKMSGSKNTSKLYPFLPFLLLDQESRHLLGLLSYPWGQGLLGILEGLKKRKSHSKRELPSDEWPTMPGVCNSGKSVYFAEL